MTGGGDGHQVEQRAAEPEVVPSVTMVEVLSQVLVQETVPEPGEGSAFGAENVHGDGPSAVELPHDATGGDEHVVEDDLGQLVGAVGLDDGGDLDARRAQVDDERGEPAMA